jgi:hypothetical protein
VKRDGAERLVVESSGGTTRGSQPNAGEHPLDDVPHAHDTSSAREPQSGRRTVNEPVTRAFIPAGKVKAVNWFLWYRRQHAPEIDPRTTRESGGRAPDP